jgi:hypothetical protein
MLVLEHGRRQDSLAYSDRMCYLRQTADSALPEKSDEGQLLVTCTVGPRFTNLISSWRPFVNRKVRKPQLILP